MLFKNCLLTVTDIFKDCASFLDVSKKPRRIVSAIHVLDVDTWQSKRYPTPEYIRKIGGF